MSDTKFLFGVSVAETIEDCLYRYDYCRVSNGTDQYDNQIPGHRIELRVDRLRVLWRTPKGAWIEDASAQDGGRFILLTARKKYACNTEAEALESFIARKEKHLRILAKTEIDIRQALRMAYGRQAWPATRPTQEKSEGASA